MTIIGEMQKETGTWVFLSPISGVILSDAVNNEFTLNRVSFISSDKLPYRRLKYGFPRKISEYKSVAGGFIESFFSTEKTYAIARLQGKAIELKYQFLNLVREELAILSLSQLGYSKRRHNSHLAMSGESFSAGNSCLLVNTNNDTWTQQNEITGKIQHLILDDRWKNFSTKVFFNNLIGIINGKAKVSKSWQKTIRNAAILAGQSQGSSDIPQAFLWNMIALEMLLTRQGDKFTTALPERAEAFIGWTANWRLDGYENRIREVYKKRCNFVHDGDRESITIKDVLFTDDLILNVISNIVRQTDTIYSKEQLVKFSEKIKAEHLLGMKSKIRPKTLRFLHPNYTEEDFEKF